jgi:enamine deaminase RidA (YjgF/YER057c/UK114 family)
MTGTRGPIPARSEERRRTNTPESQGQVPVTEGELKPVVKPAAHPSWHPLAAAFYESLEASGESAWYQASDWMAAYVLCESLSRDLKPQFVGMQDVWNEKAGDMEHVPAMMVLPLKGGSLSAYLRLFNTLGVTEGDRRRIGIELKRPGDGQPTAAELAAAGVADLRQKLLGGGGETPIEAPQ